MRIVTCLDGWLLAMINSRVYYYFWESYKNYKFIRLLRSEDMPITSALSKLTIGLMLLSPTLALLPAYAQEDPPAIHFTEPVDNSMLLDMGYV